MLTQNFIEMRSLIHDKVNQLMLDNSLVYDLQPNKVFNDLINYTHDDALNFNQDLFLRNKQELDESNYVEGNPFDSSKTQPQLNNLS